MITCPLCPGAEFETVWMLLKHVRTYDTGVSQHSIQPPGLQEDLQDPVDLLGPCVLASRLWSLTSQMIPLVVVDKAMYLMVLRVVLMIHHC